MKSVLITIFCAFTCMFSLSAQNGQEILFDEKLGFKIGLDLGDNGHVFMLHPKNPQEIVLKYVTKNLDPIWQVQIPSGGRLVEDLFAAKSGEYIYYRNVAFGSANSGKRKQQIFQIDKQGNVKTFLVDNPKNWDGATKSVFCTDNYLFLLYAFTTEGGLKYRLHRFDHQTFTYKSFDLNLPTSEDMLEFVYASHAGDKIYLLNKSTFKDKFPYTILTMDKDGAILNTQVIEPQLDGKKVASSGKDYRFLGNCYYNNFTKNAYVDMMDKGVELGDFAQYKRRDTRSFNVLNYAVRGDLMVDEANNAIYIYGTTIDKYAFLQKFDLQGKLIWKIQEPLTFFCPIFTLNVQPDNSIRLLCYSDLLSISSEGKLLKRKEYKFINLMKTINQYDEAELPGFETFLLSKEASQYNAAIFLDNSTEIIMIAKKGTESYKNAFVYRFKKKK